MKLSQTDKKSLAFDIFMNTDKPQNEIAEIVGVTEKTISKWKIESKWGELKSAETLTSAKIVRQLYQKLDEATQEGEKIDADKIIKLANSIEKLSDGKATISQVINVFKDFTSWLIERNPELAKDINKAQKDYIFYKING